MTRLIEILISLAIVAVLFVVVGVVLPSSRSLSESVETNRRPVIVFDTINSLRRFKDWSPITARDPSAQLKLAGPDSGVGARVEWTSTNTSVGDGAWEIVESEQGKRVALKVEDDSRGENKRTEFRIKPTGQRGRNMEILQTYHVDYGWNLLGRYAGLYVSRSVGDNMKLGLSRMTNMLASIPNTDYAVEGSTLRELAVTERPAEHLLVVPAGAVERNNDKIKASMKANVEWIKRTMDASGLVAAGPMRIVTTELGRETYTFDVVQPVRKGSGAAPAADAADAAAPAEGEDATAAAAAAAPAVDPAAPVDTTPLAVKLQGPVQYVQTEPTRVAHAKYTGFMAELDNVRNAVRAWSTVRGYEVTGRPYEYYVNGIDSAFTAEGEYEVFWIVK